MSWRFIRKKFRFWTMLLIAVLLVFALVSWFFHKEKTSDQQYNLAAVSRGRIQALVTCTGRLEPLNTVKVGSQVSGNIKEMYADFNSVVKKGQVIALVDPAIYAAQVEEKKADLIKARALLLERQKDVLAARAKVNSSKAHLASVLATLKEAKLNYDRLAGLENKQIVSKSDLDSALAKRDSMQGAVEEAEANARTSMAQLQRAVAQVKGAEALIGQKEAALKLDQIKLDYCTIRSPIDGTVITREVDVGQTVAATLQSPVLFTIAEDLSRMQVEVDVSEADVGQIEPGQGVEFNVDAFPQNKFRAKVRQVRNVATNIQNVVTYKVIVDVDNDKQILRPGMTANVTILVAKVDDVLKIPNAALRFKPPSEGPMGKPKKASSVRDKEFFKKIVERVGLDSAQADELEKIMKIAGSKLKENLGMPEEERDPKQAWSSFFTEVFTRLHKILRENQFKLFSAYVAEFRALSKKRKMYKGRWTNVYVLDEKGRPKALRIMVGIANDSETQIIHGALHKGDKVIEGIARTAGAARRPSSNILSTMLGRR